MTIGKWGLHILRQKQDRNKTALKSVIKLKTAKMKKCNLQLALILMMLPSVVFLSSCNTVLYTANQPNTPLFDDNNKHQIKAEAGYGTAGIEFKAAYSPVNHFGIIVNGSFLTSKTRKQYFREAGIGYYGKFNKSFVYEVYGGFGFGTSSDSTSFNANILNLGMTSYGEFSRWFLQGNAGYISENFEGGLAFRFSNVVFDVIYNNNITGTNSRAWFFEPTFFGKIGSKNVKLVMSMTFPVYMSGTSAFGFNTYVVMMGIQGSLGL